MKQRKSKACELNVEDSDHITINFKKKSFKMTGSTLLKVLEHYWSEKTSLKADITSS